MGVPCCANDPASQSSLPNSKTGTMLLCREQLYLAPNRTIARPSKTPGRATQAIQSSIHPGRANPTRQISDCCSPDYLYHQFVFLKERMDTIATHGGIFTNLTTGVVKDFQIALPPKCEQQAISEKLSACDREIAGETTALSKHMQTKTGVMQDLLTGKVRVKVDETKEAVHV